MYIYIKRYFEMGLYKLEDMKVFVVSAMITADQYKEITGEEYVAAQEVKLLGIIAVAVQHAPHYIADYSLSEIASIVAIVIAIVGVISWIVRVAITKPMERSNQMLDNTIRDLSEKVNGIGNNADMVHAEHDKRLDHDNVVLAKHEVEIGVLYDKTGLKRRGKNEN